MKPCSVSVKREMGLQDTSSDKLCLLQPRFHPFPCLSKTVANVVFIPCVLGPLLKLKGFLFGKNSCNLQMGSTLGIPRQVRIPWIAGGGAPASAFYLQHLLSAFPAPESQGC